MFDDNLNVRIWENETLNDNEVVVRKVAEGNDKVR